MAATLDGLLPAIAAARDAGLTLAAIKTKFVGKAVDKTRAAEVDKELSTLSQAGAIWGPFRHGAAQYYFAAGSGPSIETAAAALGRLVYQSGVKLLSKAALEKKLIGKHKRFFADAMKHSVANRTLVELACGPSKYYLHRDVAADRLGLDTAPPEPAQASGPADPDLTFEELLPVYRRLKAEQGGFSAVKIFDLMSTLRCSKELLHRLLINEAKAGRLTIHHTTSVELSQKVVDAGIKLPGFAEPFITLVIRDDR